MSDGPQLENGYLRIANELYDEILRFNFSKREFLIVLAIIRKTYGYGKKEDRISGTQLAKMTEMDRSHAVKTIGILARKRVVLKKPHTGYNILSINKSYKNWEGWVASAESAHVPKQLQGSAKTALAGSAKTAHTKDNLKTLTKDKAQALPAWLAEPDWCKWKKHRSEIRKPLKDSTVAAQFRLLEKYISQGHQPADVIEHSIAHGYTGLYPEKSNGTQRVGSSGRNLSASEQVAEATRRRAEQDGRTVADFDSGSR